MNRSARMVALAQQQNKEQQLKFHKPTTNSTQLLEASSEIVISNEAVVQNFTETMSEPSCSSKLLLDEMYLELEVDDSDEDPNFIPPNSEHNSSTESDSDDFQQMGIEMEQRLINENIGSKETAISRTTKRNLGKEYITKTGTIIKRRQFTPLDNCRRKCKEKISRKDQKNIFKTYWKLGSHDLRMVFISGLMEIHTKKVERKIKTGERKRSYSYYYFFEINGNRLAVCQKCFLKTLNETEQILKTVAKKKLESPSFVTLNKRKINTPGNKISDEKLNIIREHINSFPAYESHYTRERSAQKYLHSDLTLHQMHKLYCECNSEPVSYSKYIEIFHTLGIKFKTPKKDRCNTCEVLKMKIDLASEEDKVLLKREQERHHIATQIAYSAKAYVSICFAIRKNYIFFYIGR